jgi:uncharacterized protein
VDPNPGDAVESSTDNIDLGDGRFSHRQIASTLSRKSQQLIILPTERCNFRCTYCYEDFLIGKMKEPIQVSIERYLDRRVPDLTRLSFHWFGGEPLMAKEVVLRLSSYASRVCNEYGVALSGAMTTNASVLDHDLFEELLSYDQRFFQITLDGWRDGHDAVRRLANGRGTFERIWTNLVATKESAGSFDILIRIHVRRDNYQSLEMLIDNLATAFGGDPRYSLDFEHLRNLGGEGGKSVDRPLSVTEMREIEVELRARYEAAVASLAITAESRQQPRVPASHMGEVKAPAGPDAEPYICYAAKPNSLLIRADGRIGKCTVAFSDERNTIGRINPDGTLTIDNGLLRPWLRGLSDLDPKALECPLSGMAQPVNMPA